MSWHPCLSSLCDSQLTDPKGANLKLVASVLKPFIANGQKYGVFWDWVSMFQMEGQRNASMTKAQQASFDDAIRALPTLFSHEYTTVLRVTSLPEGFPESYEALPAGANIAEYANRGWCFTETLWSSWPNKKTLDIGRLALSRQHGGWKEGSSLLELLRTCAHTEPRRTAPLLPAQFKEIILTKSMHNPKDDAILLTELYEEAFTSYFGQAYKLNFSNLGWGDDECVQLAKVLSTEVAKKVVLIYLSINQIGNRGMKALAAAVAEGGLPVCSTIVLQGNPGDFSIVQKALAVRAKDRGTRKPRRGARSNGERPTTAPAVDEPTTVIATSASSAALATVTVQARNPVRQQGSPWTAGRRQATGARITVSQDQARV